MIPNPRKKRQREPGENAFPLEKARKLYDSFGEAGQDITFEYFYRELCGIADSGELKKDLNAIQIRKAQERSNRLLIERGLLRAEKS